MGEGAQHAVALLGGGHAVIGQDFAVHFLHIAAQVGGGVGVQLQVNLAEAELAHEEGGGAVVAGGQHLVHQLAGHQLAALPVAGVAGNGLGLPGPVLVNLAGQLHEVPGHVAAGEGAHLHIAEHLVQQVAELVEHGFHLVVAEQGGFIAHRAAHVAAHQRQVGDARLPLHGRQTGG